MIEVKQVGDKHIVECQFAGTHEFDNPEQAQLFADILNEKDPKRVMELLNELGRRFGNTAPRVTPSHHYRT